MSLRLLADRDLEIFPILEIGNTKTIIHLLKRNSILFAGIYNREELRKSLSEIQTDIPTVEMYSQLYCRNKMGNTGDGRFIELVKQ